MEPTVNWKPSLFQRLRWNTRTGRWLGKPLACKFGFHSNDGSSWGFGGAVIDWYCNRCDKRIGETPIDDATPEMLNRIGAAQRTLGIE